MVKKKILIAVLSLVVLLAGGLVLAATTDILVKSPVLEELALIAHLPDGKFPVFFDKEFVPFDKNYRTMTDSRTMDLGAIPLGEFGTLNYRVVNDKTEGLWRNFSGKELYYNTGENGAIVLVPGKNVIQVKVERWIFKKSIYSIEVFCQ